MRDDLNDITLVIDRSGSMEAIRSDAEGGAHTLITEQAKLQVKAKLAASMDSAIVAVYRVNPGQADDARIHAVRKWPLTESLEVARPMLQKLDTEKDAPKT